MFSLSICLLFFTQSFSLQADWKDYFTSSLSFNSENLKKWAIPAISVALVACCIGYKYFFGSSNKKDSQKKVPIQQVESESEPKPPIKEEKPSHKPTEIKIKQIKEVLLQINPSDCGLHSLKNAILFLEHLQNIHNKVKLCALKNINNKDYFLKTAIPYFKPFIMNFREKVALQEHIRIELLACLKNNEDEIYKKALENCSVGISENALRHLENNSEFTIPSTHIITLLHQSTPKGKKEIYTIELYQQAFNIEKDIVINTDIVKKALCKKYLLPILSDHKIVLNKNQLGQLMNMINNKQYDNFVYIIHTIKESDPELMNKLVPIQNKMQNTDDLSPLLQKTAKKKREWLIKHLKKYALSLPKSDTLFDKFMANPYMFADLQGFWLEGNELRELINQACDYTEKNNITVIDSIDELTNAELLNQNINLALIKSKWYSLKNYRHAFIINTASQFKPEHRGHWFVVVIHKTGSNGELIVLNSEKKDRKESNDILFYNSCDYSYYVNTLANFFQA